MLRSPFPDEQTLATWHDLTLTKSRVLYSSVKEHGNTVSSGLLLLHVSGTKIQRTNAPEFLVAGVVLGIATAIAFVVLKVPELYVVGVAGVLLVGVCVGCFVMSRRVALTIFAGERLVRAAVKASPAEAQAAQTFADRVERLALLAQRRAGDLADPELGAADAPLLAPLQRPDVRDEPQLAALVKPGL